MSLLGAQEIYESLRSQNSALEAEVWALRQAVGVGPLVVKKLLKAVEESKKEILGAIRAPRGSQEDLQEDLLRATESLEEVSHVCESTQILYSRAEADRDEALKIADERAGQIEALSKEADGRDAEFAELQRHSEGLEHLVQTLKEERDAALKEIKSAPNSPTPTTAAADNDALYRSTLAELNKTKADRDEARAEIARLREALFKHVTASDALKEKPIPSAAVKAARKAYNASSAAGFDETMSEVAEAVRKALVAHFLAEDEEDK